MAIKKLIIALFFLIILLVVFLGRLKKPATLPTKIQITIGMGYIPNIQFAPFYVALQKNYFAIEGLDVKFDYGFDTDIIKLLAADKLDFGIGSGDQVILANSQNLGIVDFFNWYQKFPVSITTLAESNINKPEDFIGKTIGLPVNFGASFIGWQTYVKKNNLPEDKIKVVTIGYTQVAALTEHKVDAVITYSMNEPIQLENQNIKINNIQISDSINFVSNGLLASQKQIDNNPDLVRKFAYAFKKGLEDTINNPGQALKISAKFIPNFDKENSNLAAKVLDESIKFWKTDKLGQNDPKQWQDSVEIMSKLGLIKTVPKQALFSNDFIND